MTPEGELRIRLSMAGGRVRRVAVVSTRPLAAARVVEGKAPEEALALLPLVFGLCGRAHALAGARAMTAAGAHLSEGGDDRTTEREVALETLREHLVRIFFDWPRFLGREADAGVLAGLLDVLRRLRDDPGARQALLERLERHLFGLPPAAWLGVETPGGLERWMRAGEGLAAGYLGQVMAEGLPALGACPVEPLPGLEGRALAAAMENASFLRTPRWQGRCHETTVATRTRSPLLTALRRRYGNGLLTRLTARLTETARLALRLPEANEGAPGDAVSGVGLGRVEAARGLLVHRVALREDGTIGRYRILAPTEWNFHPRGVAARALETLQGEPATVAARARQIIHAIDPCVGYRLEIRETGDA